MGLQKKFIVLGIVAMFMEVSMAATTHTVGSPTGGWDTGTDLAAWASAQTFLVGDSLLFKYTTNHDVFEVSSKDFDACGTSTPIFSDASGSTTVSLTSAGKRYFICATPGHCSQGQKVEITTLLVQTTATPPPVASEPPPSPPPASPVKPPPTPPPASPVKPPPTPPPVSPVKPPTPTTAPPTSPIAPSQPPTASMPPPTVSPIREPMWAPTNSVTPTKSPPPVTTAPSTESPASSPSPKATTPNSSAHKSSFQCKLALAVGFLMLFLTM